MSIEEKNRTREEFERMKAMLDEMGVDYEVTFPAYLSFTNENGDCMAFPSQTYDDKLVVFYHVKEWCDTAEDALRACGVMPDE